MGKVMINRWKPLSKYHIGEVQSLLSILKSDKHRVLMLSKGHWKTGEWEPLELKIDPSVDIKGFFDILEGTFKDKDPHFKVLEE